MITIIKENKNEKEEAIKASLFTKNLGVTPLLAFHVHSPLPLLIKVLGHFFLYFDVS
jgi:hypothetical protein